jgi:cytochrome c553
MNKRSLLLSAAIAGLVSLILSAGIYAATEVKDVINMDNPAYEKHKKGIVAFTHKKHAEEYAQKFPEFYKNGCGECHHDENNKPLTSLKAGDDVKSCIACHKKPSEKPKGKDAPKLSKNEKLEYHAEALHDNCRGCHKKYNKKYKTKKAPTTCTKCHPKKKKK